MKILYLPRKSYNMEITETTLDKVRRRPRFKLTTHLSKKEYAESLQKYISENSKKYSGNINTEVATITVNRPDNNYWKPQLSLRLEEESNGEMVIRGVFGPSSSVWTFFMFLYFGWSVLLMVCLTLWFVERQIGSSEFPWSIYGVWTSIILLVITYLASQIGKHKAKNEMQDLREFTINSTLIFEKKKSRGRDSSGLIMLI